MVFTYTPLSADFIKDKAGKLVAIKKVQIGYQLQNLAHFPISFVIDEIHTSFEGRINPKPDRPFRGTEVPPGLTNVYRDAPIDMGGMALSKESFEGNLKFKIRYGFLGNEKYEIERNISLMYVFDKKTGNVTISFWDAIDNT